MKDLSPAQFPECCWEDKNSAQSCAAVAAYSTNYVENAIEWYAIKRKDKKRLSRVIRQLAILLALVAAAIPVLAEMGIPWVSAGWSAIAFAGAGALVATDKLLGLSSGWVRYMAAYQALTILLVEFRFDWTLSEVGVNGRGYDQGELKARLEACRRLFQDAHAIVSGETETWAKDFRQAIQSIEEERQALDAQGTASNSAS